MLTSYNKMAGHFGLSYRRALYLIEKGIIQERDVMRRKWKSRCPIFATHKTFLILRAAGEFLARVNNKARITLLKRVRKQIEQTYKTGKYLYYDPHSDGFITCENPLVISTVTGITTLINPQKDSKTYQELRDMLK